ncbi:putative isopenicillin N synthetase [Nadsonia fulvescens var. elongata DSM 6958]|uniref:Putative isopenicillin N synthetase n=1 Tax=Nadsonia fulvescens var. elongata DSM 6958 TaxID=857566 RepID=A0A1E3PF58_9ASCO|nr:putative isopenicillin N synthetase [Nadsonia fulvescens var. elongata DSM 6958]
MSSFGAIPIMDLSLADDATTKPQFLCDLRSAILDVGFLYLKNYGISPELESDVITLGKDFFTLPDDEKKRISMINSPHFLGYTDLGHEITNFNIDWREQTDLGTELPVCGPNEPIYRSLIGPNLWPKEELLPGFRTAYELYMKIMGETSQKLVGLIAESIGLDKTIFDNIYEKNQQHKMKVIRYPNLDELKTRNDYKEIVLNQGVGPHKDADFTSYVLQATSHPGLQVQNHSGEWIDVLPIPGTVVVAVGQALETVTRGVCQSTVHRVLAPVPGSGSRYSIPFFQGIAQDTQYKAIEIPEDILALKRELINQRLDPASSLEKSYRPEMFEKIGENTFWNRVKSHKDVSAKYYPEYLKKVQAVFPDKRNLIEIEARE